MIQVKGQRPVSVVFTGQLREKELFEKNLDALASLPYVRELILSTWHDDALDNSAYLQELKQKFGLEVVTTTDPGFGFDRFNGFRQAITLQRGLAAVSRADHVFKTRTDCYIDPGALEYLVQKDLTITDPQARAMRIFAEKVSITCCSVFAPFYIDDKLIYGHRNDLEKLCSTEFSLFKYPSSAKFGHYIRFYPAFMRDFPMFRHFILHEILVTSSNAEFVNLMLPILLSKREVALPLLVYYRIISAFFCLDWGGHLAWFRGASASHVDDRMPIASNADVMCASNAFFVNAGRGQIANADLARPLQEAAALARHVTDLRDIGNGLDLEQFWSASLREAKQYLRFDEQLAGARQMLREGKVQDAYKDLTRLLACDPTNRQLRYLIGLCFNAVGDQASAAVYLKSCLELGDDYDAPAGQLLAEIGRTPAA